MQTQLWNPWSIFDELERSLFDAASSPEWPLFDIVLRDRRRRCGRIHRDEGTT